MNIWGWPEMRIIYLQKVEDLSATGGSPGGSHPTVLSSREGSNEDLWAISNVIKSWVGKRTQIQPGLRGHGPGLAFYQLCGAAQSALRLLALRCSGWIEPGNGGCYWIYAVLLNRQKSLSMETLGKKYHLKIFEWGSKLVQETLSGENLGYKETWGPGAISM